MLNNFLLSLLGCGPNETGFRNIFSEEASSTAKEIISMCEFLEVESAYIDVEANDYAPRMQNTLPEFTNHYEEVIEDEFLDGEYSYQEWIEGQVPVLAIIQIKLGSNRDMSTENHVKITLQAGRREKFKFNQTFWKPFNQRLTCLYTAYPHGLEQSETDFQNLIIGFLETHTENSIRQIGWDVGYFTDRQEEIFSSSNTFYESNNPNLDREVEYKFYCTENVALETNNETRPCLSSSTVKYTGDRAKQMMELGSLLAVNEGTSIIPNIDDDGFYTLWGVYFIDPTRQ